MADSIRSLLALWPSQEVLAADIGASVSAVRKWAQRESVPSEYWSGLVAAALGRNISGVTLDVLAALHARPREGHVPATAEART